MEGDKIASNRPEGRQNETIPQGKILYSICVLGEEPESVLEPFFRCGSCLKSFSSSRPAPKDQDLHVRRNFDGVSLWRPSLDDHVVMVTARHLFVPAEASTCSASFLLHSLSPPPNPLQFKTPLLSLRSRLVPSVSTPWSPRSRPPVWWTLWRVMARLRFSHRPMPPLPAWVKKPWYLCFNPRPSRS